MAQVLNFVKFLRTPLLYNTSRQLLLTDICFQRSIEWVTPTVTYADLVQTHIEEPVTYLRCRSSRPELFCKEGVIRNFTKFTEKHLRQSIFFNEVAGLMSTTLLKKRIWHRCFPVNFVKFLRTPCSVEQLRWLLLLTELFCEDRG